MVTTMEKDLIAFDTVAGESYRICEIPVTVFTEMPEGFTVDRDTLTAATVAFCQVVDSADYRPMVYFNTSQGRFRLNLEQLGEYPWWLAKYSLDAEFLCRVDLWQYTDQGTVPGIYGNVDIDLMFTDYGLGKEIFGQ